MPPRPRVSPVAVWAGLITLYFVWGSTYLGIRIAIDSFPPYLMIAIRFAAAGGLMFAWVAARGQVGRPTRREWRDSAIVGVLLLTGGMGLIGWAEQTLPTGIAALLVALMPAWVALLGRVFFAERLAPLVVIGIIVGLVGVGILVGPTASGGLNPVGLAAGLLSPVLWGSGSLYAAHRARLPRNGALASAMQMLCAGVASLAIAFVLGELGSFRPSAVSLDSVVALAYLVTVGSIVGFGTFGWLVRVAPLSKVTTYAYVNPVVAFILGAIVLGEPITLRTVVAAAVIVAAVALIVTARGRESAAARARDRESAAARERDRAADAASVPANRGTVEAGPARSAGLPPQSPGSLELPAPD